jgi:hypothetical protein
MRIRSGFRDYYDHLAAHDVTPHPAYHRVRRRTVLTATPRRRGRTWHADDDPEAAAVLTLLDADLGFLPRFSHPVEPFLVGFCGTAHVGFAYAGDPFWSPEGLMRAYPEVELWDLVHDVAGSVDLAGPDPYRRLGCPAFLIRWRLPEAELVRNPSLERLGFAARVDPWTAWQTLDTFLGSTLAEQRDLPDPIDDGLRRDLHGFDDRSFKASPGGPTRKRRKP